MKELTEYIAELTAGPDGYTQLIQSIKTAHSKEVNFRNKAFQIYRRELIFKHLSLEDQLNTIA